MTSHITVKTTQVSPYITRQEHVLASAIVDDEWYPMTKKPRSWSDLVVRIADGTEYSRLFSDGEREIREVFNMTLIKTKLNLEGAVWRYET